MTIFGKNRVGEEMEREFWLERKSLKVSFDWKGKVGKEKRERALIGKKKFEEKSIWKEFWLERKSLKEREFWLKVWKKEHLEREFKEKGFWLERKFKKKKEFWLEKRIKWWTFLFSLKN